MHGSRIVNAGVNSLRYKSYAAESYAAVTDVRGRGPVSQEGGAVEGEAAVARRKEARRIGDDHRGWY